MSFPGIPALPPAVASAFSAIVSLVSDIFGLAPTSPQWGIFLNGAPVVLADSVVSFDYRQDYSISNYPVEKGSFSSYNKVQRPFYVRIRFAKGGSVGEREAFLSSIQQIIGDTQLYDIVTPEVIYVNANLVHQDYRRSDRGGAGLITVDVGLEEVRSATLALSTTPTAQTGNTNNSPSTTTSVTDPNTPTTFNNRFAAISNPQSPQASPMVNGGNVQPLTPSIAQQQQATQSMVTAPFDFPL